VTNRPIGDSPTLVCVRVVRSEPDRFGVVADSPFVVLQIVVRLASIVVRLRQIWLEPDGFSEIGYGLIVLPQIAVGFATTDVSIRARGQAGCRVPARALDRSAASQAFVPRYTLPEKLPLRSEGRYFFMGNGAVDLRPMLPYVSLVLEFVR
jgi:hypothetical protein